MDPEELEEFLDYLGIDDPEEREAARKLVALLAVPERYLSLIDRASGRLRGAVGGALNAVSEFGQPLSTALGRHFSDPDEVWRLWQAFKSQVPSYLGSETATSAEQGLLSNAEFGDAVAEFAWARYFANEAPPPSGAELADEQPTPADSIFRLMRLPQAPLLLPGPFHAAALDDQPPETVDWETGLPIPEVGAASTLEPTSAVSILDPDTALIFGALDAAHEVTASELSAIGVPAIPVSDPFFAGVLGDVTGSPEYAALTPMPGVDTRVELGVPLSMSQPSVAPIPVSDPFFAGVGFDPRGTPEYRALFEDPAEPLPPPASEPTYADGDEFYGIADLFDDEFLIQLDR